MIAATAVLYLGLVLAVGLWATRRTKTAQDFFVAGKDLGLIVTSLAIMSAIFSGFLFIGGPGLTYRLGVASFFISFSVGFTGVMMNWTLAKRLRLLAEVREIFTVPDVVLARWGSRRASGLAAIAIIVGTLGYLGAQLQALGVLVDSIFPLDGLFGAWSAEVALALGTTVVLLYAVAGGMLAGVYTDVVQGLLMMAAAGAVFWQALRTGGGLEAITRRLAESESFGPEFLDPLGGSLPALGAVSFFFVFAVGCLGQPQTLHKFFMLGDPRKLRWFPAVVGGAQVLVILIWFGIGLAVPALVVDGRMEALISPDEAAPRFLLDFVPGALAGLVFAGILAAIMSTADSFLNIASAALVRDLPRAFGRRLADELRWGRWATLWIALGAVIFARLYGDLVALLGTFAYGIFGAALAPALVIGMNSRRVSERAAVASMVVGLVSAFGLEFLHRQALLPALPKPPLAPGAMPAAAALLLSFTTLFAVAWLDRHSTKALDDDVEAVLTM
ncbi:MAG: sodium/proline symporter [Acidobacteriota bacterium]